MRLNELRDAARTAVRGGAGPEAVAAATKAAALAAQWSEAEATHHSATVASEELCSRLMAEGADPREAVLGVVRAAGVAEAQVNVYAAKAAVRAVVARASHSDMSHEGVCPWGSWAGLVSCV